MSKQFCTTIDMVILCAHFSEWSVRAHEGQRTIDSENIGGDFAAEMSCGQKTQNAG